MINPYENNLSAFYKDAVNVQNACNLSGIVNSFYNGIIAVRQLGSDERQDPAVLAFLFKIMDMCGYPDTALFMEALKTCERLSQENKPIIVVD